MTREKLEQNQIWLYVAVLVLASGLGLSAPELMTTLDQHILISAVIAVLMFGMFTQLPFTSLKESLGNRRFMGAILTANYVAVPIVVWLLSQFLPQQSPVLLGVYLVLLTPCIDYVIIFTHLGRGNEKAMLLSTPVLFVTQMLLLPAYLWMFMGRKASEVVNPGPFAEAFLIVILLPLVLAIGLQLLSSKARLSGQFLLNVSAWIPVPLMALTLFIVVSSQISKLSPYWDLLIQVIPIYIAFMLVMPFISRFIVKWFRLDVMSGRAVIFSSGTRNSLVVLPLALALPENWSKLVAAIIVTQTIVELAGELIYVRFVPNVILRDKGHQADSD
ncbi:Arsenite efflux pump ArsB, ACR3 family [Paenibacillus sp. UNCCL117]|uniref:arsenic resistance protein n=1 Tax=unclassified Paenibacillus TaxID=185978 RepID=UPI00088FB3F4|nr:MULTISPECIES: bile acid:sodium symporter [unclassified Paenibacillus]SDD37860.1 Arsenite efflux pump ArsB, ACR3 family [Paenibacillus sp. cl123]SFW48702.1 Arsenite efflux pump ArsB, ACR3 family [Paenibacillus sp. UNCCL117]